MSKPITREEFAAVSVKTYEVLSGAAAPAFKGTNTFRDTSDAEVLKAYNLGITQGVSNTAFEPNTLINREQAATMLTRVYKKFALSGWTPNTDASYDSQFKSMFTRPTPFADDDKISDWAKDSVYFMNAKGLIMGIGNNMFAPKATTKSEEITGYAQATREQALLIAARMVKKMK